jgi:hypothetical protein
MRHDRCRMLVIPRSSRTAALPERDRLDQALSVDCRGGTQGAAEAFHHRRRGGNSRHRWHLRFQRAAFPRHEHEVQLYAFDVLAMGEDDLRQLAAIMPTSRDGRTCRKGQGSSNSCASVASILGHTTPVCSNARSLFRKGAYVHAAAHSVPVTSSCVSRIRPRFELRVLQPSYSHVHLTKLLSSCRWANTPIH